MTKLRALALKSKIGQILIKHLLLFLRSGWGLGCLSVYFVLRNSIFSWNYLPNQHEAKCASQEEGSETQLQIEPEKSVLGGLDPGDGQKG